MTARAAAAPSRGVRVGANLAGGLLVVGAFLTLTLAHWPGLVKLAGLLAVALGFIAVENWRHPERMTAWTPWAGLPAVPAVAVVAVVWPALPGEQVLTVAIAAAAVVAYTAASVLAWRRRGRR